MLSVSSDEYSFFSLKPIFNWTKTSETYKY